MEYEEIMKELEELPIDKVVEKIGQLKLTDQTMIRAIVKTMSKKEFLFLNSLAVMMIKEQLKIGYKKEYSLSELVERLPWKKSQASVKLRKAVNEGILIHEKRKYSLNMEHDLVKKTWHFYTDPSDFKEKFEQATEIKELIKKKEQLEKKLAILKEQNNQLAVYKSVSDTEVKDLSKEIAAIINSEDTYDKKEEIVKLLNENIEILVGYKKINQN